MTRVNFLWPRWAVVANRFTADEVRARGHRCLVIVRKAALLSVDFYEREKTARMLRRMYALLLVLAFALTAAP